MAVELEDGEREIRRVTEEDIPWVENEYEAAPFVLPDGRTVAVPPVKLTERHHPLEHPSHRWVWDRQPTKSDPDNGEWVLVGTE